MEWLRIGDVVRRTGLTHRTLRHYDERGLLVPSGRTGGDYRLYSPADLERLLAIQHLKSLGMSLPEIERALDDPGFDAADALARHVAAVEARIAAENELLARLRSLQDAAGAGWDEVLDVIALTERLRHGEPHVRFRAVLDAPGAAPIDELVDVLRHDPEPGVREAATWAIVQRGPDVLPLAVAQLADPDAGVREQMAHVLGKLRDPAAAPALAELLADPSERVVTKAAQSLGRLGGSAAIDALAGVLGRGDAGTRASVVTALGLIPGDAAGPIAAVLRSPERSSEARADAAEALGLRADAEGVPALVSAVEDSDEDVRIAALMALAAAGGDEAAAAIAATASHGGRTGVLARRLAAGS